MRDGDHWALPRVEREGGLPLGRTNRVLSELLGLDVTTLRTIGIDENEEHRTFEQLAVLELHGEPGAETCWFPVERILSTLTTTLREHVARAVGEPAPPERMPWQRAGWFSDACAWISSQLRRHGRTLTGPVEQRKNWCLSSLLRAPATGGAVWLKATADLPLFVDEGRLTTVLGRLFPAVVPAPIAIDSASRLMLLEEFGDQLGHGAPTEAREELVVEFARLQLRSTALVGELSAAGCVDRGLERLASQIGPLLESESARGRLEDAEVERLTSLAPTFVEHCDALAAGPIPDALVHGDLHLGNVASAGGRRVIYDWTDACITHPFLDLSEIVDEQDETIRARVLQAYLAEWRTLATAAELDELWRLAQPLCAVHQAVSYSSIVANVEADEAAWLDAAPYWLRRAIAAAERVC